MNTAAAEKRKTLRSLTAMRFFAALWVVLLHFATPFVTGAPAVIQPFVAHGQSGVTFFFVLSGFILSYNYMESAASGGLDKKKFWQARLARVYPIYLASLLLALPVALWIARKEGHLGDLAVSAPVHLALLQSWIHPLIYKVAWNTPSWSLSAEAFFYAIFPFFARRIGRASLKVVATLAVIALALAALSRLGYALADPDHLAGRDLDVTKDFWAGVLFFNPAIRSVEFVFGMCVAPLAAHLGRTAAARDVTWPLTGAFALFFVLFAFPHPALVATFAYPATLALFGTMVCLLSLERAPRIDRALSAGILVLLGEASYSMYMLQRPIADLISMVSLRKGGVGVAESPELCLFFAVVLVAASIFSFLRIEVPLRDKLRPKRLPHSGGGGQGGGPEAPPLSR